MVEMSSKIIFCTHQVQLGGSEQILKRDSGWRPDPSADGAAVRPELKMGGSQGHYIMFYWARVTSMQACTSSVIDKIRPQAT